ncbi:hypothetical protein [Embleya hyalina]|uniref:Uncharacterized protein n=1 Tax=Embleya hyalina TaxID=516124 RepID=A0A401YHL9_9ACTN|nr:hypothetical protein [Embleya hyalina]GCD94060.1 hypothetical protein EHYA_01716 [Embleya hyalina]
MTTDHNTGAYHLADETGCRLDIDPIDPDDRRGVSILSCGCGVFIRPEQAAETIDAIRRGCGLDAPSDLAAIVADIDAVRAFAVDPIEDVEHHTIDARLERILTTHGPALVAEVEQLRADAARYDTALIEAARDTGPADQLVAEVERLRAEVAVETSRRVALAQAYVDTRAAAELATREVGARAGDWAMQAHAAEQAHARLRNVVAEWIRAARGSQTPPPSLDVLATALEREDQVSAATAPAPS